MENIKNRNVIIAVFLMLIILLIYLPAVDFPFQYDDVKVIVMPDVIKTLSIDKIFEDNPFRFLLTFSFAVNYFFSGLSPSGYRTVNILLHIENTLLFYLIFSRIEELIITKKKDGEKLFFTPSSVSAFFFAVSPLMIESVTYVSGRSELLCGFFFLLSIYFFLSFIGQGKGYYLIPSLLAGSASVLSKERGGMLVFVIFLIIAFVPAKFRKKKVYYALIPYFLLFIFYIVFRQQFLGDTFESGFQRDFMRQIFYQGEAQVLNLKLLSFPVNLCIMYPHYLSSSSPLLRFAAIVLIVIFFIALTIRISSSTKAGLFCWAWFYIIIAPNIIVPLQDIAADRWLYLPSAGIFFLAGMILCGNVKKPAFASLRSALIISVILCFTLLSIDRNMVWRTEISLWQDAVAKASSSARPYNNFGVALGKSNRLSEAKDNFLKSLSIDEYYSPAWSNFGFACRKSGDEMGVLKSAAQLLRCGEHFARRGQIKEAITSYRSILTLVPDSIAAMGNLASIYIMTGNYEVARLYLRDLLEISPSNRMAREMLSKIGE